jgi:epsilon-lactone hydrolase
MSNTMSTMPVISLSAVVLFFIFALFPNLLHSDIALAQDSTTGQNTTYQGIPATISKEAQEELRKIAFDTTPFKMPDPNDLNEWKKLHHDTESVFMQLSQPITALYRSNIKETKLGGVQALDIKPKSWEDNGKVLVYTHGGAYTFGSANSTIGIPVLAANTTGLRVISIN